MVWYRLILPTTLRFSTPKMMTSSNGKFFHVTGPLCGEFTGHRLNSPLKGQRRGALVYSLNCARTNGWENNREAGDLRHDRAHPDVNVMMRWCITPNMSSKFCESMKVCVSFPKHQKMILIWWFDFPIIFFDNYIFYHTCWHGNHKNIFYKDLWWKHFFHISQTMRDIITIFGIL